MIFSLVIQIACSLVRFILRPHCLMLRAMTLKACFFLAACIKLEMLLGRYSAYRLQVTSTELGWAAASKLLVWRLWASLTNKIPALHLLNGEKYCRTPIWNTYFDFSITACFSTHQSHKHLFETDLISWNYLSCQMPAAMNSCLSEESLLWCWLILTP